MALPCCQNVEIVRKFNISKEEFDEEYLSKGQPVVIEGALEDWPARKWTLDSLTEVAGDNLVYVRQDTNCEDYKKGKRYNVKQRKFRDYVSDLQAGNEQSQNSYLAVQNIKKAFPQLKEDAPAPDYVGKLHGGPFLWIARPGHYEYCHYDPDDGFLMIIEGHKCVRLMGCDLDPLYPNPLGSKGRTIQSSVDFDNPDLEAHPLFANVTCHYTVLEPGQMLYIPAFWWHQVSSLDQCISVNVFWGDAGTNTYLNKIMETRWSVFRHWLLNIVEQNRETESFERVLSRLPESMHTFLMTQWKEAGTPEQLQHLVQEVLDYLGRDELPNERSSGKNPPPLQIRGLLWRS